MPKTYKSTITYGDKWSKADKKISVALSETKRIPFFIHELAETIDKALEDVKVDDVVDYIVPKWKAPDALKVKDASPDILQGYHGIALEKALKARYKTEFMKDAFAVYKKASTSTDEISTYEKKFQEDLKFE